VIAMKASRGRTQGPGRPSSQSRGAQSEVRQEFDRMRRETRGPAADVARRIREQSDEFIKQRKAQAAEELSTVGEAIHRAASKLHQAKTGAIADYVDDAAKAVERAAKYVERSELQELVNDVARFARARPMLVIGTVVATGLVVGRFITATPARQEAREGRRRK